MHFSTREKSYTDLQSAGKTVSGNSGSESQPNLPRQNPSPTSNKGGEKRQGNQVKRQSILEGPKNDQLFEAFPQLNIHRVDSAEHREKLKLNYPVGGSFQPMSNSLISKPYTRGDTKFISTSVEKTGYLNTRQNALGNQSQTHKASYKLNYATYKKDGNNLIPNYTYAGVNSEDGSDNEVPSYKRLGNNVMTMERMDMEISPKMVSSVISRQSSGKDGNEDRGRIYLSTSSKNRDQNKEEDQAYELFASRHPNQSIRKSTIEISKVISSNAITELQKVNQNQDKKLKKLEKQLQEFKNSLKKWDQIKHRYQMDLESKSRQIFDLERANKRLTEQVQGIRAYRTMDSVEQVIIVRLKEQIMQLNKKIIEMQAEHYKNQKTMIEKQSKKDGSSKTQIQSNDKQGFKKLEQINFAAKKQAELLGIELQKEKEKSWNLQRQKEEYLAEKLVAKQNNDRETENSRKQILTLRQDLQKYIDMIRAKDAKIDEVKSQSQSELKKLNEKLAKQKDEEKKGLEAREKLNAQLLQKDRILQSKIAEVKKSQEKQFNDRLLLKEQEYKNALNNEMRLYEAKIIEQGKNEILKHSEEANQGYINEISQLRRTLEDSQNYIRQLQQQGQNMKYAISERDNQIDHLKQDNLRIIEDINKQINEKARWKQEESFIIENQIKLKLQQEFEAKEKQLEARVAFLKTQEQSVNQLKIKLEQQKQQEAVRIQQQTRQREQKVQAQLRQKQQKSINELEASKLKLAEDVKKLTEEVRKIEVTLSNGNKQVSVIVSKKTQVESEYALKQRQVKQIEGTIGEIKKQLQTKLVELSEADSQRKSIIAETQRLRETEEKSKTSNKQLEDKCKQLQNKFNAMVVELTNSRSENFNLEQKFKQSQIQLSRFTDTVNTWKSKSENLENTTTKLKVDLAALEKERQELRIKAKEAEVAKKYHQLLPQYEMLQQKLKIKEDEISSREAALLKIKQHTQSGDTKAAALMKEIRVLTAKLDDTQAKLKSILSKIQIDESKYKELYDKLVSDSQTYMEFIKKLQQDNELIAQKYWKIRKLVKKEKINDQNDLLEKHDYTTYRQYLENHIMTHFKKMILPAFESKILQKISLQESNLSHKLKRLSAIKSFVELVKKRRIAAKAQLKN